MRYARSRVYDRDDAEDLCSEAWLRFYEGYCEPNQWQREAAALREQGTIRTSPEKVLFGILRHLLADYYKKKKQIRTALLILEEQGGSSEIVSAPERQILWAEFEEHVVTCLFALKDTLKLAWLLKFDPARLDWIAVLSGASQDSIRALQRQTASRDIFIDEPHAAALMRCSVWSFRRKYEKAQRLMNELMRKHNWGDLLDQY